MVARMTSGTLRDHLRLRFEDPALEQAFIAEWGRDAAVVARWAMGLGLLIYVAFGWLDLHAAPQSHIALWWVRFGVAVPCFAVIFGLTFTASFARYSQPLLAFAGLLAGLTVALMPGLVTPEEPVWHLYYAGLMIVVMWICALSRLRAAHAVLCIVSILVGWLVIVVVVQELPRISWPSFTVQLAMLTGIVAMGLSAAWQFEHMKRRDFLQRRELAAAHAQVERLLLNVLPESIKERLEGGEEPISDDYETATVFFADLVSFTRLAAELPSAEVVEMLNEVFSAFDALTSRHGLEKIKTIGDAYMVAGGLPVPRQYHAAAACALALDMLGALAPLQERFPSLALRVGIHTGPATAGVIGRSRFAYDLWGSTVNLASRMESHGEAGRVQVTEAVVRAAEGQFRFEPRGTVEVKGAGPTETWWLTGRA